MKSILSRLFRRAETERLEDEQTDEPLKGPVDLAEVRDPLEYSASDFLFPSAFSIGDQPVRARLVLLDARPATAEPESDAWFYWKAATVLGTIGCYWRLPSPGPLRDADQRAAWGKFARAVAQAGAAETKRTLNFTPSLKLTAFTAAPCSRPAVSGKALLRADFRYAVRGVFRKAEAYCSISFAQFLARACGDEQTYPGPLEALAAASRALETSASKPGAPWKKHSFTYPSASGPRPYLPLFEFFNLLSDEDLKRVIQNRLVVKAVGPALGALFMYRAMVKTEKGDAERILAPFSFDRARADPLFPASVFEEGRLDPANAASGIDDFLSRNDAAYTDLYEAHRKGSLALGERGVALLKALYVESVFPGRRAPLDALVKAGKPLSELFALPERLARRTVDASGARVLAAAIYGSKEQLALVSKWCSKGKRTEIAGELERLEEGLREGILDVEATLKTRLSILEIAEKMAEAERREAAVKRG